LRVALLGGTGFIGRHIARQFAERGDAVVVVHRGRTRAALPASVREVLTPESLLPITRFPPELTAFAPEVIVHTMAMGEADAAALVAAFGASGARLVLLSSGDVYRAYGRFTGIEPGAVEPGLLRESAKPRSVLYPYRKPGTPPEAMEYWYEKILAERAWQGAGEHGTVLRLPKVYGPGGNADLATVYRFRHHPGWRWTHGYVENVAAAVVLAATHPRAAGRIYNVGESPTPTVGERLLRLPPSALEPDTASGYNFAQDIAYDTARIRTELGYQERIPEPEAMAATVHAH